MSRKPRSASSRFLYPSATSSAVRSGSEVTSRYLPSSRVSARILVVSMISRPRALGAGVGGQFGLAAAGGGRGRRRGGGQPGAGRGDAGQLTAPPVQRGRALGGGPGRLVGVGAEHPAQLGSGVQADLLDPQVVPH